MKCTQITPKLLRNTALLSRRLVSTESASHFGVTTVSEDDIRKFLATKKMAAEAGHTQMSFLCPGAPKGRATKRIDENRRLFVNTHTGAFVCNYCLQLGDYSAFRNVLSSVGHKAGVKECRAAARLANSEGNKSPNTKEEWLEGKKPVAELTTQEFETLKQKLGINIQLQQTTFVSYDCYASYPGLDAVAFPYYGLAATPHLRLREMRTLSVSPDNDNEAATITALDLLQKPPEALRGLFGWHLLSKRTSEVILTANELDALAIYQSIGHSPSSSVAVLALPCGSRTLPQQLLPLLEQFEKITLWLGSELTAWQAAKQFAKKLGEERCYLVRPSERYAGAHDALAKEVDVTNAVISSYPAAHKAIVSFRQLRQDVYAELAQSEQVAGVRWRQFPRLNELLKGHRRGELTVFTGPTGAGKTTFISNYSIDLAMQGVATLWGSFEISNVRLCKLMLTQFAGRKLIPGAQLRSDFQMVSNQFEQLPIHFLTFHGSETLKKVIEAMTHAVYVHDIMHVVIDNLQFMMDISENRAFIDRFMKQDQIIAALRRFATQQQCHVTLVIHPRKEADGQPLTNSSIFGGAKAVQEADNVMILQSSRAGAPPGLFGQGNAFPSLRSNTPPMQSGFGGNSKSINVTKNRFDGELGKIFLRFNRESLSFEQLGGRPTHSNSMRSAADSTTQAKSPMWPGRRPYTERPMVSRPKPVLQVDDDESFEEEDMSSATASVDALLADLGKN